MLLSGLLSLRQHSRTRVCVCVCVCGPEEAWCQNLNHRERFKHKNSNKNSNFSVLFWPVNIFFVVFLFFFSYCGISLVFQTFLEDEKIDSVAENGSHFFFFGTPGWVGQLEMTVRTNWAKH